VRDLWLPHEQWSARLVTAKGKSGGGPTLRPAEAFEPGTPERCRTLLESAGNNARVAALVNSQLDCDRSTTSRTATATRDLLRPAGFERFLAALCMAPDGSLALHPKGLRPGALPCGAQS